jgi:A/G-specific adenine glycosylase
LDAAAIRKKLVRWYEAHRRDLPWRRTRDPYAIWISEVMLQQTRIAAVIPYYERFLERFPAAEALAQAPEREVLTLWSGLGYYSRARNLQKAARQIVEGGGFPEDHASIKELAGVGEYTAAAVASIAFGQPFAAVDGNVRRVLMRLTNSPAIDVAAEAGRLLERKDPGRWNQALMELGAVVCLAGTPRCGACPISTHCEAYKHDSAASVLPKPPKPPKVRRMRKLLIIQQRGNILLAPSPRVKGFWDLPEPGMLEQSQVLVGPKIGSFRHSITASHYVFEVRCAAVRSRPLSCRWWRAANLKTIPLSTASKKALAVFEESRRLPANRES